MDGSRTRETWRSCAGEICAAGQCRTGERLCGTVKLAVTVENLDPEITVEDTGMSLLQGDDWSETVDGSKETYIETDRDQKNGDYIIFDLGLTQEIHDIAIFAADGTQRIYQADLSVSSDNTEYKRSKASGMTEWWSRR